MCILLVVFWYQQNVLTHQNGYHGPHFKKRGNTQGGLISPTLFNLIVYNVVRNCLDLTVEDQLVAQEGLGLVLGRCLVLFYDNNGMVGLWYMEWLQGAMIVLIGLFFRYRMVLSAAKYKSMTCQLEAL